MRVDVTLQARAVWMRRCVSDDYAARSPRPRERPREQRRGGGVRVVLVRWRRGGRRRRRVDPVGVVVPVVVVVGVVPGVGSRPWVDVGEGPQIRGGSREDVAEDDLVDDHDAEVVEHDGELHGGAGGVAAVPPGARGVRRGAGCFGGVNEEPDGGGGDDVHGAQGDDAAEDAEDAEGVWDGHDARADDAAGEVEHRHAGLLPRVRDGGPFILVKFGAVLRPERRALLHPVGVVRVDVTDLVQYRRHGDVSPLDDTTPGRAPRASRFAMSRGARFKSGYGWTLDNAFLTCTRGSLKTRMGKWSHAGAKKPFEADDNSQRSRRCSPARLSCVT